MPRIHCFPESQGESELWLVLSTSRRGADRATIIEREDGSYLAIWWRCGVAVGDQSGTLREVMAAVRADRGV